MAFRALFEVSGVGLAFNNQLEMQVTARAIRVVVSSAHLIAYAFGNWNNYSLPVSVYHLLKCVKINEETLLQILLSAASRATLWLWRRLRSCITTAAGATGAVAGADEHEQASILNV